MFMSMRLLRIWIVVLTTASLGLLAFVQFRGDSANSDDSPGSDDARVIQPGAPGEPGRELSEGEFENLAPPTHTAADIQFMQQMIPHHAQALDMTSLVADRSEREEIALLAQRIEISQTDEIDLMARWLTDRGLSVPTDHETHEGWDEGELHPGMLTDAQLESLAQAAGEDFDRLFLELMIHHHGGALLMVQELYNSGGGLEPAADRFARDVNADQSIEIGRMQDLLAEMPG